eukprot:TRINITY_DN2526_c0_g5_i1.p1 TRINITY_DN2526_c0_g5~~TRINITY_DN2526_c0_g5_i1.p1  ORF type:complete len:626 (-),score=123.32 TRINITY_DN2526_c0_g5_i1:51-1928(-)
MNSGVSDSPSLEEKLSEINNHLQIRVYLSGYTLTLADCYAWIKLTQLWDSKISHLHTRYVHLFRWYNYLTSLDAFKEIETKIAESQDKKSKRTAGIYAPLDNAEKGKVVTRFPPEPSGYLHIGHIKAALLNSYYANHYEGVLILRFDDTNPTKEKVEYEESIVQDLKTIGFVAAKTTYTSDYFDNILEVAERLIKQGDAFVDLSTQDEIKLQRANKEPSPYRNTSPEDNMSLWQEMKQGTEKGKNCVLRIKINPADDNGALRDPAIYRCVDMHHARTGDKFKVYPLYDFACPIVDSLEGVTHAMRSSEYHDRNDQYQKIIEITGVRPVIINDFSRLNFTYTLLSKRKLQTFVDKGYVPGWDDPRFPTIQGLLRRGLTVEALKEFITEQGSSKATNLMDINKLWAINRGIIDPIVPRYFALVKKDAVVVDLSGGPSTPTPRTCLLRRTNPSLGTKTMIFYNKILLELEDINLLKPDGEEVTLMNWGNAIFQKYHKDGSGKIVSIDATLNENGDFKATTWKLHWLAQTNDLIDVKLVHFDHLITKEKIVKGENFEDFINPNSRTEIDVWGEPALKSVKAGDKIQFERKGYYRCDSVPTNPGEPYVFFEIPDGHQKKEKKKGIQTEDS